MKTTIALLLAALLTGCGEKESLIRKEAVAEIAEAAGNAEAERFLEEGLRIQLKQVETCRRQVATATDARALALAEDALAEARRELRKIERELEAVR
jgi:ribosomal protein L19E